MLLTHTKIAYFACLPAKNWILSYLSFADFTSFGFVLIVEREIIVGEVGLLRKSEECIDRDGLESGAYNSVHLRDRECGSLTSRCRSRGECRLQATVIGTDLLVLGWTSSSPITRRISLTESNVNSTDNHVKVNENARRANQDAKLFWCAPVPHYWRMPTHKWVSTWFCRQYVSSSSRKYYLTPPKAAQMGKNFLDYPCQK